MYVIKPAMPRKKKKKRKRKIIYTNTSLSCTTSSYKYATTQIMTFKFHVLYNTYI